ncbi:sulfite exporter TauE/SafE family protein [Streptomyces canus]|uniref:sulfite exporter TauE/SafE family protein n=1 Tax=Streptomyces canus TaxID=58343 RepID=UPI00224F9C41|nr:sulfite exporter TauE/SafE family protein [Streptomyces canus]MCX4859048.1 sulfite exporter TauE/SafE family protein [Streptomyces canus]WSW35730.1 sulfite exporter TauE/SafE family protein [Streptomyces canus]
MDGAVLAMVGGLLVLSVVSGMLGLGVAFAAVPFLGLFMSNLVDQVQPLSLLLNGITALFAAFGFARSGLIDWRRALGLAAATTAFAPLGALLAHVIDPGAIWAVYLLSVGYLAYRLFRPVKERPGWENYRAALAWAVPISVLSGLLGVGPGFLLMPALILAGFETKKAAAINAVAVTPPSFSALLPHLSTAQWDGGLTLALLVVGAIGAFAGARLTSRYVPGQRIKQLFGVLIVVMTAFKIVTLLV